MSFDHDAAGRIVTQTLPDGRVIRFAYDPNGNVTSVTPPSRPAHAFSMNRADLVSAYTPPPATPGGATQYTYNRDRQLTSVARPDGRSITIGYDAAGRPLALTLAGGRVTYAYDDTVAGLLATATAVDGTKIDYAYEGSLLTHAEWSGLAVKGAIDWTYNADLRGGYRGGGVSDGDDGGVLRDRLRV